VPRHPPCALCSLTCFRPEGLKSISRRKPPSVGSSSRVLSSPTNPTCFVQGASRQPTLFCSRLTLTSCVLVKSETQLSTEIVLLGSVTNLAFARGLMTFRWSCSSIRLSGSAPKAIAPENWGVGDHECALRHHLFRVTTCPRVRPEELELESSSELLERR
jgi:hypothetical protein